MKRFSGMPSKMLLLIVLLTFCMPLFGQDPPDVAMGTSPSATYHGGDFDSVDMGTGRLNLNIPLVVDRSQRGKLNFTYGITYTSNGGFTNALAPGGRNYQIQTSRYGISGPAIISDSVVTAAATSDKYNDGTNWNYAWSVFSGGYGIGAKHPLGLISGTGVGGTGTWESIDGSGIRYVYGSGTTSKEGILFGTSAIDPNGNEIVFGTFGFSGNGGQGPVPSSILPTTDTLGRSWTFTQNNSDVSGCPTGGLVAPSSSATWSVPGPAGVNGGVRTFKLCYSTYGVQTNFTDAFGNAHQFVASVSLMTGIVLPDGTTWEFDYDNNSYGDLIKVIPPTGGYITYGWATAENSCSSGTGGYGPWVRVITSRTVFDGVNSNTWNYTLPQPHQSQYVVTDPLGNATVFTPTAACTIGTIQYYSGSATSGTLLKTIIKAYRDLIDPFPDDLGQLNVPDPQLPTSTTTIWPNGQQSQVQIAYDSGFTYADNNPNGGNYTSSYGLKTTESRSEYGSGAPGPTIATTSTNYLALTNSSYVTANNLALPTSIITTNVNGYKCGETDFGYDESAADSSGVSMQHVAAPYSVRGNLTSVKRQLFNNPCSTTTPSMTPLTTTKHIFDTGMVHTSFDPVNTTNPTTYAYSSSFYGAYVTQTTLPSTSSPTLASHIVSGNYDFNTGLLTSFTDQNSNVTNFTYDVMLRPTNVTYPSPDGGQTNVYYANPTTVEMQKSIDGTRWTDSFVYYDGLGRESRSMTINGETTPYDQADTCYDADGRVGFKSYPYQGNGTSTPKVCSGAGDSFLYDPLNRVTQVTHSDSSTVLTTYMGRATSVQDEGNGSQRMQRISQVDGLGRLTSVCEVTSTTLTVGISGSTAPVACGQDISGTGFLTTYTYDALGDLNSVTQGPLSGRTFAYDSLSRLLCADNPEVQNVACPVPDAGSYTPGTIRYGYDANSNLISKIAPMPNQATVSSAKTVTTTMAYDALNRLLSKSYTNNDTTTNTTPSVTFNYDQTSALGVSGLLNTDGRSSSSTVSGSQAGEVFSYDKLGRVKVNSQCTPQNCAASAVFPINYTYDLLGDPLTATNGAGVTFTYGAYNRALRITGMTSSLSDSNHPGTLYSSPHYNAAGSVTSAYIGNTGSGVTETRGYDARLRINSISDGSLYTVTIPTTGGYAPNGDILLANDSVNGNWTYGYDAFNRLASASASGQAYTYAYDRFGNRWQQNGPHSSQPGFDANNHMISGLGVTYDAAGNETNDGTTAYAYDSENRIISATNGISGASSYSYDSDGRRIRKTTATGGTVDFLYDLGGREITQVTSAGSWTRGEIYAGGRHLGTYTGGTGGNTFFTFADWLGTERARSTSTGTAYETCTSLPFGDWLTCTGSDPSPMHFTGKERDSESGLDNFGARYDSSQYGRFMTPDPLGGIRRDPQTLNKYIYVRNNPMGLTDPTGLYACGDDLNACQTKNDKHFADALIQLRNSGAEGALLAYNFGKASDNNGVVVNFKSQGEMTAEGGKGSTSSTQVFGNPGKSGTAPSNVSVHVDFLTGLKGSQLEREVAHEGSHLQDDLRFILSFNPGTGKFNSALNFYKYDTEFKAFEIGAMVKPYEGLDCSGRGTVACGSIAAGPKGYSKLDQYLTTDPAYRQSNSDLSFSPAIWPQ